MMLQAPEAVLHFYLGGRRYYCLVWLIGPDQRIRDERIRDEMQFYES